MQGANATTPPVGDSFGGKKGTKGVTKTSWVDIASKGKTKGKIDHNEWNLVTRKRNGNSGPFKLRDQDWPNHLVVPKITSFGNLIDRKGTEKPFIALANTQDELTALLEIIKGDKSLKAQVLVPCKPGEKLVVDEYPDVTFTETRYPVVDKDGKLITKVLASWSANNPEVHNHVRVIVPSHNRPTVKTVADNRANTLVLRLTADVRFSSKAGWNKLKAQPGTVARQWCITAAPSIKDSLMDSWSWELLPGASGNQTVVKGLLRVKKGAAVGRLLTASGRCIDGNRIYLDPLNWEDTPHEGWGKKPFVGWIEKLEKETDMDYCMRATKLAANHGVARGWRQLGLRSMTSENVPKSPETWILRSAPRGWDMSDVESFLVASQFSDVSFTSKKIGTIWNHMDFQGSSKW